MKKTIVAVAVAALAATSANAATIYSKDGTTVNVSGSLRLMLDKTTDHRADLQDDGSRLIINVKHELGEGFSALANIQTRTGDLGGKGDDGFRTKYVYAGFAQENIGTLTFGKQVTAGDSFKLADPTENFNSVIDATDLKDAEDKVVNFVSTNMAGFGLEASYIFAHDSAREGTTKDGKSYYKPNQNGYQVLAKYENDFDGVGFAAHAIYAQNKLEGQKNIAASGKPAFYVGNGETYNHKVWGLAAAVNVADFGFAVDYAESKASDNHTVKYDGFDGLAAEKIKAWQIATTYQVSEPMDVYMGYHQFKGKADKAGVADQKVKGFVVGSHYQLAQNVQTYVEYTTEKGDWDKAERQNAYYAGLRVFF